MMAMTQEMTVLISVSSCLSTRPCPADRQTPSIWQHERCQTSQSMPLERLHEGTPPRANRFALALLQPSEGVAFSREGQNAQWSGGVGFEFPPEAVDVWSESLGTAMMVRPPHFF